MTYNFSRMNKTEYRYHGKIVIDIHVWRYDGSICFIRHAVTSWHHHDTLKRDMFKERFESQGFVVYASSPEFEGDELYEIITAIAKRLKDGAVPRRLDISDNTAR